MKKKNTFTFLFLANGLVLITIGIIIHLAVSILYKVENKIDQCMQNPGLSIKIDGMKYGQYSDDLAGITYDYPIFDIKEIDEKISGEVDKYVNNYKLSNLNSSSYLKVNYCIYAYDQDIVSIAFVSEQEVGDKKDTSVRAHTYDITYKKEFEIEDVLNNDTDFMSKISEIVYNRLIKEYEIKESELVVTMPVVTSNQEFLIDESGISVIYNSYDLSRNYDGIASIDIKWSELEGMVAKNWYYFGTSLLSESTEKYIALTYDDGPNPDTTTKLISVLDKYDVKATFFVVGYSVDRYPEVVEELLQHGHLVGTHTQSHKNLATVDAGTRKLEINNGTDKLNQIANNLGNKYKTVSLIRPPYGSRNDGVLADCKAAGLSVILWNIDSKDWVYREANAVALSVINDAKNNGIILMHDIYDSTVDATDIIIPELQRQGYKFVTVTELLALNGQSMKPGEIYSKGN